MITERANGGGEEKGNVHLGNDIEGDPTRPVKVHDLRGRLVQLQRFRPNLVYNSMAAENHRVLMKEARYKWAKDVPGDNELEL